MPKRSTVGMHAVPKRRAIWVALRVPLIGILIFGVGLAAAGALFQLRGVKPRAGPLGSTGSTLNPPASTAKAPNAADPNLTARFAKMLVESGVFRARQSEKNIVRDTLKKRAADSGLFDPQTILSQAATVTAGDITTIATHDPASVKQYFNAVYAVYQQHLVPIKKDDLEILAEVLETKDYAGLNELDPILAALEQSFRGIKAIPVPKGYGNLAVLELNYILKTKRAIETFLTLERDPLAVALMYPERLRLKQKVRIFHELVEHYLAEHNITFQPGEGGFAFFAPTHR